MTGGRAALIRVALRTITATFFFAAAALLISQFARTADWPAALGRVEELAIVPSGDADDSRAPGDQVQIQVGVAWELDGVARVTTRLAPFDWVFPNRARAERYLERAGIAPGQRVPVWYNPTNPDDALLVRAIPWYRFEVITVLIFLVLLPSAVVAFSVVDLVRGGRSRDDDASRGRFW